MNDTMRICKECGKELPISDYPMCRGKPRIVCKYCVSAKYKQRYNTDKAFHDRVVAAANKHHVDHREKHLEQMQVRHAERYATDEEYRQSWNKRRKARYATDSAYREKVLSINHAKRASISESDNVTAEEWLMRLEQFDGTCAYCGSTVDIERDHVIPLSKGGRNIIGNILPACKSCNRSKGAKDMVSWYHKQPMYDAEREEKIMEVLNNG